MENSLFMVVTTTLLIAHLRSGHWITGKPKWKEMEDLLSKIKCFGVKFYTSVFCIIDYSLKKIVVVSLYYCCNLEGLENNRMNNVFCIIFNFLDSIDVEQSLQCSVLTCVLSVFSVKLVSHKLHEAHV